MGPLVTTEWLAGALGTPGLIVFDATKYLPNEPKDGKAEYLRAHHPETFARVVREITADLSSITQPQLLDLAREALSA